MWITCSFNRYLRGVFEKTLKYFRKQTNSTLKYERYDFLKNIISLTLYCFHLPITRKDTKLSWWPDQQLFSLPFPLSLWISTAVYFCKHISGLSPHILLILVKMKYLFFSKWVNTFYSLLSQLIWWLSSIWPLPHFLPHAVLQGSVRTHCVT